MRTRISFWRACEFVVVVSAKLEQIFFRMLPYLGKHILEVFEKLLAQYQKICSSVVVVKIVSNATVDNSLYFRRPLQLLSSFSKIPL